jgi:hypothetical protein
MGKRERLRRREAASNLSVRELMLVAVGVLRAPVMDNERYRQLLVMLGAAADEVAAIVGEAVADARRRNWSRAELTRQVERRLGPDHAAYLARERGEPALGVKVFALLVSLPPLPDFGAAPRRGRPADTRMLEKVRALLAKAESTTFPEEAEALSAKAQELMARHAIDEAMVGGGASGPGDAPTGVRVPVDDPYASAKSILLSEVASANRCRAVWSKGLGFCTVMGFDSDLEFVDVLYTSLLVQATSAMVAAGSQVDRSGRSRTRSFRQAFLLAYATRIGHRLRAAEAASRAAAAEQYGDALLPVLADRSAAVQAASAAAFPGAISRSVSISNAAGWAAGNAAADLASLSTRTEVPA